MPQAVAARDFAFETLEALGISRNLAKGQPEPSHLLRDHLGYGIDSSRGVQPVEVHPNHLVSIPHAVQAALVARAVAFNIVTDAFHPDPAASPASSRASSAGGLRYEHTPPLTQARRGLAAHGP